MASDILVPVESGMSKCSMCGSEFKADLIIAQDSDLCPECKKKYGGMAFVYCNKCKSVVTRIPPGLAMGILVKPYDMVHVNECPQCTPGVVKSIPVEVEAFRNEKGGRH